MPTATIPMPDPAQQAPGTFAVSSVTTGACFVPDVFHDYLSQGLASLDFARVWNGQPHPRGGEMVAQELRAAAQQFGALARQCERFASEATS